MIHTVCSPFRSAASRAAFAGTRAVAFLAATLALTGVAAAQSTGSSTPVRGLDKQIQRLDLGVQAAGQFTQDSSGTVIPTTGPNPGQTVSLVPSNTVGALVTLRYVAKPWFGLEANYGYARYTENFSYPPPNLGVQTNVSETTFGYVVTPDHQPFGLQPFVSAGIGTIRFKPTPGGGEGLPIQYRMGYYYSAGLQKEFPESHFGVRAGFRQLFYLAPDFGQNYFTIKQRTFTSEPTVGFFLRF